MIYGLLCPNNQQLTDVLADYNNEKDYRELKPFYNDSRFVQPSPLKEEEKPIEATLSSTEEKQTRFPKQKLIKKGLYIVATAVLMVVGIEIFRFQINKNQQEQPVEPTKASSLSAQEFVTPTAVSPIENPIGKVVTTPKEEKPTEEKIIAKPIEKPKEEKSTEEKIIAKPIEDKPIAKSIEEKIVEKKGEDNFLKA